TDGGEVRMLKELRIGHKFKEAKPATSGLHGIPYNSTAYVLQNKIFLIMTILPKWAADALLDKLRHEREYARIYRVVESNWPLLEIERARNASLFTRKFEWFLERFALTFPGK